MSLSEDRSMIRRLSAPIIGPHATAAELTLSWGAALVAGLGQAVAAVWLDYSALQTVVAVMFAIDVGGGVVVNSTISGRAWWHRPEYQYRGLFFIAHVHVLVVAALWPSVSKIDAVFVYAYVLMCATVTTRVPREIALPVSVALTSIGIVVTEHVQLPHGLAWLPPLLLLKLVVGHAVGPIGSRPRAADKVPDTHR